MQEYKSRAEVPEKYKWNLTDYFSSEEEYKKVFNEVQKLVKDLNNFKGCTKDASKLYTFLKIEIKAISLAENLYVYSYLINDQELGIDRNIKRKNQSLDLYSSLEQSISFFAPELLKLSKEEYQNLFVKELKLKEFKADLDRIYREKEYILTEQEEKIISQLTNAMDNFDDLASTLINNEHDYGKVKLNDGDSVVITTNNYRSLLKNKDRIIRKKVYNSLNKKIDQYGATSAGLLNSYVKGNTTVANIHHFKNAWEQKLFGLNLSNKVFKSLVNTVEKNTNVLQKYYDLKKEILGLDKMYYYDTKVNMTNSNTTYTIEQAQDLIRASLSPLSKEYIDKFDKIIKNRYIDYCGYKGKCSGGYSFGTLTNDSRILMSFHDDLDSVSTIAHEAGHNIHHQYLCSTNDIQYRGQTNIVCEVASLTNECLLSAYLAKNGKNKEEKLAGIENLINVIISNLFGATREGKIEQDMYQEVENGGSITKELIDNLVRKSYKKYFGKSVALDKNIKNSWILRSHYYMNFYLYSYAISISVATNVAKEILNDNKKMLDNYFTFLKTGSDVWTKDAFKVLNIDLEDESVYENAIDYFEDLVNQYKEIYNSKEVGE